MAPHHARRVAGQCHPVGAMDDLAVCLQDMKGTVDSEYTVSYRYS